jgi:hypothetical protein
MISELFEDLFSSYSSISDRLLAGLLLLLMVVVVALLTWLAYVLVDQVNVTATRSTVSVIEEKHVIPGHTATTLIPMGKVLMPITSYQAATYHLEYQIEGRVIDSSVEKPFYDQAHVGDRMRVEYGRGRLSGSSVPTSFQLAN